jgi:glutaconate CoA-transferase subunit A
MIIALHGCIAADKSRYWAQRGRDAKITRTKLLLSETPAMNPNASSLAPSKVCSLHELAASITDGTSIGIGGVFLHRGPFALVRELARQGKRDLEIIKPSPGYDLDLLCRAGAVRKVRAGIVAMEGNFGLAQWYRKAIERKQAVLEEHA